MNHHLPASHDEKNLSWRMEQFSNWMIVIACGAIPTSLALAGISMALSAVFWLPSARRPERWLILRHQPVAWLCAAIFVWVLIGGIYSTGSFEEIVLHTKKYAKLLVAAALMGTLIGHQWQKRCMNGFFVGMLIVLATQYAEIFWDLPWAATHNQGWNITHTAFGDHITQGILVSFLLGIALWKSLDTSNSARYRLLWSAVTIVCVLSLVFLSAGRTGYVLLIMVCLTILILRLKGMHLLLALLLMLVAFITILSFSTHARDRVSKGYLEVTGYLQNERQFNSLGGRMENYRQSIELMREKPIFGWGTGSFHQQACRVASTPEMCQLGSWHPHNQYFLFGIQGGLIGVGLFLAVMLAAARLLWRSPPEQRALGMVLLVILAVDSLFNSSLFSGRESHFFTVFLVVVLAGKTIEKRKVNTQ